MSAETLRRAAALMRERAEAATEGPHTWGEDLHGLHDVSDDTFLHAASWHPAVALAVAKVMDDVALAWEICDDGWTRDMDGDAIRFEDTVDGGWLTVARTYLGEAS